MLNVVWGAPYRAPGAKRSDDFRASFRHAWRLGLLSQVAARTTRARVQAAHGTSHAARGVIACVETFGSVTRVHPHLHVLMTDGAFRRDGSFRALPPPEPTVLAEPWRRAVLAEFVRLGWLEQDDAAGMPAWPHSGFGAYAGPRMEDREGTLPVRYSSACASPRVCRRRPVAAQTRALSLEPGVMAGVEFDSRAGEFLSHCLLAMVLPWIELTAGRGSGSRLAGPPPVSRWTRAGGPPSLCRLRSACLAAPGPAAGRTPCQP